MDFGDTIKSLYEERDLLNQAIATLERVHAGGVRQAGQRRQVVSGSQGVGSPGARSPPRRR